MCVWEKALPGKEQVRAATHPFPVSKTLFYLGPRRLICRQVPTISWEEGEEWATRAPLGMGEAKMKRQELGQGLKLDLLMGPQSLRVLLVRLMWQRPGLAWRKRRGREEDKKEVRERPKRKMEGMSHPVPDPTVFHLQDPPSSSVWPLRSGLVPRQRWLSM